MAWLLWAAPAGAADALRGKTLYLSTPGGISCSNSACHGTSVSSGRNKILRGANSPSTIQNAINNDTGGMGIYSGVLTATDVADIAAYIGNPNVTGTPAVSIVPASLAFGTVNVGSQSGTQTVTVNSTGTAPLPITSIATTTSDFPVTGGTCRAGTSVAAGASCTVLVKFVPVAAGAASATLTIAHGASGGPAAVALSGTGTQLTPVAQIAPASLSFSQSVGTASLPGTATLSNTGTGALHVSSVSFGGTSAPEYAAGPGSTCAAGVTLAPGANCVVDVVFTPAAGGSRPASLLIAHDDAARSPSRVSLSGSGTTVPRAQLSLDRVSLDWTAQPQGTASAPQVATVGNTGSAAAAISAVDLGGSHAGDFLLDSAADACQPGASLAPGATCTLTARFQPTVTSGARSATLTLRSDAANDPVTLGLNGIAAGAPAPAVTFTPGRLDFGSVNTGSSSPALTARLANTGTAPLSITSLATSSPEYALGDDCPPTLAAGSFCTLSVGFAPTAVGALNGNVILKSNAAGSPHRLALRGTGVVPSSAALAWVTPAPMGFSGTSVGQRSAAQSATLANTGTAPVTVSQIAFAGANAADFVLDAATDCPIGGDIAVGGSCTISVAFLPGAAGSRAAQLDVIAVGADPGPLALSGIGIAVAGVPLLTVTPEFMTLSGATNQGLKPQSLVLANAGSAPLDVTGFNAPSNLDVKTGPGSGGTCPALPFQLMPGQSCSVMVVPHSDSAVNGEIAVLSSSNPAAPTVKVSGAPLENAGAGGCSIGRPDAPFDPVWLLMLGGSIAGLWLRRRPG